MKRSYLFTSLLMLLLFSACSQVVSKPSTLECMIDGKKVPEWICEAQRDSKTALSIVKPSVLGQAFQEAMAKDMAVDDLVAKINKRAQSSLKERGMEVKKIVTSVTTSRKTLHESVAEKFIITKKWLNSQGTLFLKGSVPDAFFDLSVKQQIHKVIISDKELYKKFYNK